MKAHPAIDAGLKWSSFERQRALHIAAANNSLGYTTGWPVELSNKWRVSGAVVALMILLQSERHEASTQFDAKRKESKEIPFALKVKMEFLDKMERQMAGALDEALPKLDGYTGASDDDAA